ncbi:hypothetical protein SAMN05216338_1013146 [Bradyrhizobium sp. Rc2d]|nr:hypothetical protein SAMN05216338_1013146 [Bradyrhizobium sp. Rc2d]
MKVTWGVLSAAVFALTLAMTTVPSASACNGNGNCPSAPGQTRGAAGPIAGAGLPILAIGYGVYWLVRRRRTR